MSLQLRQALRHFCFEILGACEKPNLKASLGTDRTSIPSLAPNLSPIKKHRGRSWEIISQDLVFDPCSAGAMQARTNLGAAYTGY